MARKMTHAPVYFAIVQARFNRFWRWIPTFLRSKSGSGKMAFLTCRRVCWLH